MTKNARWCVGCLALLAALLLARCLTTDSALENRAQVSERPPKAELLHAPTNPSPTGTGTAEAPADRVPVATTTEPGDDGFRQVTLRVVESGTAPQPVVGFEMMLGANCSGVRTHVPSTTTDSEGRVVFRAPDGPGTVAGRGRLASGQVVQCALPIDGDQTAIEWVLPRAGLVVGRVVERGTQHPVPGMTVRFVDAKDSVQTDAQGGFVLSSLVGEQIDLEVTGANMGIEFCQERGRAWDIANSRLQVTVEVSRGIRVVGRIANAGDPSLCEVRLVPLGRVGLAPGKALPAGLTATGEFAWPAAPTSMACRVEFVISNQVRACVTWMGSDVDTDLGPFTLPETCKLRLRRSAELGKDPGFHVSMSWPMRIGEQVSGSRLQEGRVVQHFDWTDHSLERDVVVPIGECLVSGFASGRPLVPVTLQAAEGVVVDLTTEPARSPWLVTLEGDGSKSGTITAHGSKNRLLGSARIGKDGIARLGDVRPEQVELLRWLDSPPSGWQKLVEAVPGSSNGPVSLRIDRDAVLLDGVVAIDRPGRVSVRILAKASSRTVTYVHERLAANVAWQVRIEPGLEWELVWSLVDSIENGRTTIGGRVELGLIAADRSIVVR